MYRDNASQVTTRWEYTAFTRTTNDTSAPEIAAKLNGLGGEGWELVSCIPASPNQLLFLLKRLL